MKTNKLTIGVLAHVDAGKTTLAEGILYLTGSIRKMGRVDHRDAFLDTNEMERARGITIFSKQACFSLKDKEVTLLDTPGHVDFSPEMERTLQVLDYAVLIISGADGVQGHVLTLWRLLQRYRIPVFLFINKMDQEGTDRERLMEELQKKLDDRCLDFGLMGQEEFSEELAVCDEALLEKYLETGSVTREAICGLVAERKVFPCYFGSALKLTGVEEFLEGLYAYTREKEYPEAFGAKVYKISRDAQGNRLTHMKITGGTLRVKMMLSSRRDSMEEEEVWEEKADQIRIYSGAQFTAVQEAAAGTVCAVTGLSRTASGEGLGLEPPSELPVLEPVLTYQIRLPEGSDVFQMFLKLRQLEEEEPQLHIVWKENLNEIHAQVMGVVQMEILKNMIQERFGVSVTFDAGAIVYKETIRETVEGVGHFEPLRHYAEVHLLLEPGERGSGMQFETQCSEDILDRSWQRLVLTHLEERVFPGVLTGSEITDMKIILASGRAHLKHTEGGDFRQATYRAVRQGLKKAQSVLLEPVYEFRLEIPAQNVGRAMTDIQKMHGTFDTPETDGETAVLTGTAPVSCMRDYQREVTAYTRGCGHLNCTLKGYEECHNAEEVIAAMNYDSEADTENPTGSVFCSHGAGFVVPWYQVEDYMHLESCLNPRTEEPEEEESLLAQRRAALAEGVIDEEELEEIFSRTYGTSGKERRKWKKSSAPVRREYGPSYTAKPRRYDKEYLLVDGYNIIFAWDDLKELAEVNIEGARNRLMDILGNYQGYTKKTVILVFDAYKVEGGQGEVLKYHNIYVVYTREAETADQYIEKTVHEIGRQYHVTVATSDALEQVIILGQGAKRLSAQGLKSEIEAAGKEIREKYESARESGKTYLAELIPPELRK